MVGLPAAIATLEERDAGTPCKPYVFAIIITDHLAQQPSHVLQGGAVEVRLRMAEYVRYMADKGDLAGSSISNYVWVSERG